MANQHNLRAVVIGTGEFYLAEGAKTASEVNAKGWTDFGNCKVATLQPEVEEQDHYGSYDGVRRKDKTVVTRAELGYLVSLSEVKKEVLEIVLLGRVLAGGLTQTAITSQTGDTFPFTATPAVIGKWYDIRKSGVRVREISAVTLGSLVAGTDYVLDAKFGRVRFLTAQSADVAVTALSAAAVTSSSASFLNAITPLNAPQRTGLGRLRVFDQDAAAGLVYEHDLFGCSVRVSNQPKFDGENYTDVELTVDVTDPVGTVHSRD